MASEYPAISSTHQKNKPGEVDFFLSGFVGVLKPEHGSDLVDGVDGGVDHFAGVRSRQTKSRARLDNGRCRKSHYHHT